MERARQLIIRLRLVIYKFKCANYPDMILKGPCLNANARRVMPMAFLAFTL